MNDIEQKSNEKNRQENYKRGISHWKIDKMNPNPKYYVFEENSGFDNIYQEGNKIVCDTKKQKIHNYVHAH